MKNAHHYLNGIASRCAKPAALADAEARAAVLAAQLAENGAERNRLQPLVERSLAATRYASDPEIERAPGRVEILSAEFAKLTGEHGRVLKEIAKLRPTHGAAVAAALRDFRTDAARRLEGAVVEMQAAIEDLAASETVIRASGGSCAGTPMALLLPSLIRRAREIRDAG